MHNDLPLGQQATIYLVHRIGRPDMLGTVPDDTTGVLYLPAGGLTGTFRLLAQLTGRDDILSEPFNPAGLAAVTWSLGLNRLERSYRE